MKSTDFSRLEYDEVLQILRRRDSCRPRGSGKKLVSQTVKYQEVILGLMLPGTLNIVVN